MNEAIALRERRVFTLRGPSLPRDPFEFTFRLLYNYYVCVCECGASARPLQREVYYGMTVMGCYKLTVS